MWPVSFLRTCQDNRYRRFSDLVRESASEPGRSWMDQPRGEARRAVHINSPLQHQASFNAGINIALKWASFSPCLNDIHFQLIGIMRLLYALPLTLLYAHSSLV